MDPRNLRIVVGVRINIYPSFESDRVTLEIGTPPTCIVVTQRVFCRRANQLQPFHPDAADDDQFLRLDAVSGLTDRTCGA